MTSNYHTPITTGAAANASVVNAPIGDLDSQINSNAGEIIVNASGISSNASGIATNAAGITTNATAISALASTSSAFTTADGAASAAQKVVTVDSSTGFVDGADVVYTLAGGSIEYNTIDTVDTATRITLDTNIGTGGIADGEVIAFVMPDAAGAIGNYNSIAARMAGIDSYPGAVRVGSAITATNATFVIRTEQAAAVAAGWWCIVGIGDAEVDVVQIGSVSGTTITLTSGHTFTYAHAADELVIIQPSLILHPEWWGAVGDGSTDDIAALHAMMQRVYTYDGATIEMDGAKTYYTEDIWLIHGNVHIHGNGATIKNAGTGTSAYSPVAGSTNANSNLAIMPQAIGTGYDLDTANDYDTSVTVTTASEAGNFAQGDYVMIEWGTGVYDTGEQYAVEPNIVRSVTVGTGVIDLEYAMIHSWTTGASPLPATVLRPGSLRPVIKKLSYPFIGTIRDLTIQQQAGGNVGANCWHVLGAKLENFKGSNIGETMFNIAESRSVTISGAYNYERNHGGTKDGSLLATWMTIDLKVMDCTDIGAHQHSPVLIESQGNGTLISGCYFEGRGSGATYPINAVGASLGIMVTGCRFVNYNQFARTAQESEIQYSNNIFQNAVQFSGYLWAGMDASYQNDNIINSRKTTTDEWLSFTLEDLAASASFASVVADKLSAYVPADALIIAHRIQTVGTISSGTATVILKPFAGELPYTTVVFSSGAADQSDYEFYSTGSYTEPSRIIDAGAMPLVQCTTASLSPAGSIDLYVELLVRY